MNRVMVWPADETEPVPDLRDPRFWGDATAAEVGELLAAVDAVPGLAHALHVGTLDPRWSAARDALTEGTPIAQVAAELGVGVRDVAAGLRSWADRIGAEADRVSGLVGWNR